MNAQMLIATARALVAGGKGLLAMDESNPTCDRRLAAAGITPSAEVRRAYREMLITTPGLGDCISGTILYDETIRQSDRHGSMFVDLLTGAGIIPGIKVDFGAKQLALHPGETVTEGLDGLRARLAEYGGMGARFAKWRAVIGLQAGQPSDGCVRANIHALARYAALCQEAGIVPVVEPEVLMAGEHDMARCEAVTADVLRALFGELQAQGVMLEAIILKPNMILPGLACPKQDSVPAVAEATVRCLLRSVPAAIAGVAFLSGGQSGALASARLNAINVRARERKAPWPVVFSFARAIQQPAIDIWRGDDRNFVAAQSAIALRARCNRATLRGQYGPSMEGESAYRIAS